MAIRSTYNEADSEAGRRLKGVMEDIMYTRGVKPQDVAARINITAERLYKYLNKSSTYNNLPAYLLPFWHKMVGPELLLWINHEAGCATVDLPEAPANILDATQAAAKAMKECSEALNKFAEAVQDDHVSARDLKEITKEVREATSALLGLQLVAEKMKGR